MIGGWEWVIIIGIALVIFGARRIPEIGKSLGQGIRSFKEELSGDKNKNSDKDDKSGNAA
jgi:sec-independent protein translocase protein TatA